MDTPLPMTKTPAVDLLIAGIAEANAKASAEQRSALENMLGGFCKKLEGVVAAMMPGSSTGGGGHDHGGGMGSCPMGGKCDGTCDPCRYKKLCEECGPVAVPMWTSWQRVLANMPPTCYMRNCKTDPLLDWHWMQMASQYGLPRLDNVLRLDDDVVPFDENAGAHPPYVDFPTNPIAAGQSALLRTTRAQQGPFRPGCAKVQAGWNGDPKNGAVSVTYFVGPRDLEGLTADALSNGTLVQYGRKKKLSLYDCGTECFLLPWPRWQGCDRPIVTYAESLYVLVEVSAAAGDSTIATLDITILKAGTDDCNACLSQCKTC